MSAVVPVSDLDLFSDKALFDPYPLYEELRSLGPVVRLDREGLYVFARDKQVREGLANWEAFSSASGVAMNDRLNPLMKGSTLASDPPAHDQMRKVLGRPLAPGALRDLKDRITDEAERLVHRLVKQRKFDAVTELARYLPLTIVSDLVGLPESNRDRMLAYASAGFNAFGPLNQRARDAFPIVEELFAFNRSEMTRDRLRADGWAAMLFQAADSGEISLDQCMQMLQDYIGPSLDTTISATANAIWLFATYPEQWEKVRNNPNLIPNAINEIVRIESPIQGFSRFLTREFDADGVAVPPQTRVLFLYASANRDERKWDDPQKFDVERRAADQLGFGHGIHRCIGANLARLEMSALLAALASRVKRFSLEEIAREPNNVIRGWRYLKVSVS